MSWKVEIRNWKVEIGNWETFSIKQFNNLTI